MNQQIDNEKAIVVQVRLDANGNAVIKNVEKQSQSKMNSNYDRPNSNNPYIRERTTTLQGGEDIEDNNIGGPFDKNNIEAPIGNTFFMIMVL